MSMPSKERSQRSVLITGCSSGIGACVAHGLRERGYRVFATARQEADVQRLMSEGFESYLLDLTDSDTIANALEAVLYRTEGKLYALFNNGAYAQPGAVEDLSRACLTASFETNLFGWHDLTVRVLPIMRAQGYGRIIQNSSVLGFTALKYRGAYNATKFALEGLSDTLRLELHGSGIYLSLIEPGPIHSRINANALQAFERWIDPQHSTHREHYVQQLPRLLDQQHAAYKLPPEAVLKRVIHALESDRPRRRYPVTMPTYLFSVLKRVAPTAFLDWMQIRVS
ncbi:short-chain dehydrogenase/reductase SDR [Magnetococcus marinus MC-1]|uniref:Short-chain dehydrogenase/reductase SDR n=1 Tax=Magnetococcus marinus (strain ATCC BAA-1437 / JCM 17883 / MC-1) TaxID=156889 RepID=A0LDC3_MAGMM|nr:SDR family oxidoreductase [Magnetococcus marinus]ABK45966.1 short-chain dehydrogenase/reductase SDR [Magnetococcus marinus MC-1]